MNKINSKIVSGYSSSMVALLVALSFSAPVQAAEPAAPAAVEDPGTITVTARKREENLLTVPLAIRAMSPQEISQRGIVSVTDLVDATPGINVSSNNSGRNDRSFQQISMRGFTPSTTDSTLTASFIDGVPVSSASAMNAITDPARVEVLKGSQNAYFGRNAFAGAINVVNKLPADHFQGSFSASAFSRKGYDIQGSIESPIIQDVLGVRVTGRVLQKGGSYINGANANERLGDQQTRTGTVMIVLKPITGLTIKAFGLYSEDHDGPSAQGMISAYEVRSNNGALNIPAKTGSSAGTLLVANQSNCTLSGLTAGRSDTEARTSNPFICGAAPALIMGPAQNTYVSPAMAAALANGAYRPVSAADGVQGYGMKRKYKHAHINLDYDIGHGFTVSSMTGFNDEMFSEMAELDNYDSSSLYPATTPTAANGLLPFYNFPFVIERTNRDFSQEVRVAFDNKGPFNAMIGANYLWTKAYRDLFNIGAEALGATRPASTMSSPQQVRTTGVFGSASYDVTSQFTINLEGRYQTDKVYLFGGGAGAVVSADSSATTGIPAGTYAPMTAYYSKSFNNFMPRAILNYKITPDIMAYASWSKAANVSVASFNGRLFSGTAVEIAALQSIDVQAFTRPEKLTTFEIGVKGKLFDRKLTFALAAFNSEWTDQYNSRSVFAPSGTTVTGLANSGRSLIRGLELDMTATPTRFFTLNMSGAINDTNIRSFADPSISRSTGVFGNGFVGKSLPLTSRYSFSISPQFNGSIPGRDNSTWFARADLNYKSKQFLDAANYTWIKDRTVVNARIGVNLDKIGLELFATNLFNNRDYTSIQQNVVQTPTTQNGVPTVGAAALAGGPFSYLIVGLPELRTVGIKASVKF